MIDKKLLILPLFLGIICLAYAWHLSYPLTIYSANDYVFNNLSILYWIGLPLTLTSLFLLAITLKNQYLKWILSVSILLTLYSLSFYYSTLPTSDSQFFRGLNEYFLQTNNLDPTMAAHDYYSQPTLFILAKAFTSISGLSLSTFEFLIYIIVGVLLSTGIYLYASKKFINAGPVVVTAFFVSMYYFLNYQAAPFTLALAILVLLFVLETTTKNNKTGIASAVLFAALLLTHSFVPLFYILYLFLRALFDKNKKYFLYSIIATASFLLVQLTLGNASFIQNVMSILTKPSEYSNMISVSLTPANPVLIDEIAQFFTRFVAITSIIICGAAFLMLVLKKQVNRVDRAILLTGIIWSGLGLVLFTLGTRAIAVAFIPVSLGTAYLFNNKRLRVYLITALLILLTVFCFIPIRQTFSNEIQFQSPEAYQSANFFINNINWQTSGSLCTDYRTLTYIQGRIGGYPQLNDYPDRAGTIFYTEALAKSLLGSNYTIDKLNGFDITYDDGYAKILIQPNSK